MNACLRNTFAILAALSLLAGLSACGGYYDHDTGFVFLRNSTYATTPEDVVAFYNAGGVPHEGLDPAIRPLGLDTREVVALVAFLKSLTGANVNELVAEARAAPPDNRR